MPKHTPGPFWRDDEGFIAAGADDTYVTVADCDCSIDIGLTEREANKTLFIAALELLAALELVKQACLFADDDGQTGVTGEPHIPEDLFANICAAIARATE